MNTDILGSKIQNKEAKIIITGLGYIGTCIGAVLADAGFKTVGIDIDEQIVNEINRAGTLVSEADVVKLVEKAVKQGNLSATLDFSVVKEGDIIIITVGTPLKKDHTADLSQLKNACESIAPFLSREQLVIIKSTIPPLTTETLVLESLYGSQINIEDILLAFCPERVAQAKATEELKSIPEIVGGINQESTDLAAYFFEQSLGVETIRLGSPRAAELTKLADNLWIDLNIALANELAKLADILQIDVLEVIHAANSLPKGSNNVNILTPSVGVGGYCLTKDPWFLHDFGRKNGLELEIPLLSRRVNEGMPQYSVDVIIKELQMKKKKIEKCKIAILGLAFKNNTGDCRHTPVTEVIDLLTRRGCSLAIHDPLVTPQQARSVTSTPLNRSIEDTLKGADCVAYLAGHDAIKNLSTDKIISLVKADAVIFDGRMYFSRETINQFNAAGLTYRGVGRI